MPKTLGPRDHTAEASPCVLTEFIPMVPPFTDEDIEIFRTRIRDPRGWAAIAHCFAPTVEVARLQDSTETEAVRPG